MLNTNTWQGKIINISVLFTSLLTLNGCFTPQPEKPIVYPHVPAAPRIYQPSNPRPNYPVRQPGMQKTLGGYAGGSGGNYHDPDSGCSVVGGSVSC